MPALNLQHDEPRDSKKSKNKMLKIVLGIGVLIAVPVIGTTLAASISINSGGAVQFGQGVSQATACDSDITVTPTSTFSNTTGAGSFNLATVKIENIASTCNGKIFKIQVFPDSSGALTIDSVNSLTALSVTYSTTPASIAKVGTSNITLTNSGSAGDFTLNFVSTIPASSVYKITVETTS